MFQKIKENYKNLEKKASVVLKYGLQFCFLLTILAISILLIYDIFLATPTLYYIGITIFRLSLIFGIEFIICAFVADKIKKQLT